MSNEVKSLLEVVIFISKSWPNYNLSDPEYVCIKVGFKEWQIFFFFFEIVGLLHPLLFYPASNNIFNTNFFVLFFCSSGILFA